MKRLALLSSLPFVLFACADRQPLPQEAGYEAVTAPIPSYDEYKLVYQQMEDVLKRYFIVRASRYDDGYIVATSEVSAPQGMPQRIKVVGKVVEDEDGFFEPQIHVYEQYDMSDTNAFSPAIYQPEDQWRTTGRNHSTEAALVEEVWSRVRGNIMNPQTGAGFKVVDPKTGESVPPGLPPRPPSIPLGPQEAPRQ